MALRSRVLPATLAAGLALTALAACGGGKLGSANGGADVSKSTAPQPALQAGLTSLTNQQALDVVATLGVSPQDLVTLSAMDHSEGSMPLTLAQAQLITGGSFEIISKSTNGATISQAKQAVNTSFTVNAGGGSVFEFRTIGGQALYVRADVPKILMLSGKPANYYDDKLTSLPPTFSFAKDAVAGDWLKLDLASLQMLEKQYGGMLGATPNPSQAAAGQAALLGILSKDVTATRGPDSPKGDHLVLTTNAKTLTTDYTSALGALVPGGAAAFGSKTADVPDQTVTIDAYLKGGTLSEVDIDLAQFAAPADKAKLGGKAYPLVLTFKSGGADVSAPATSTTVDLQSLISGALGGLGAASGSGSAGSGTVTSEPSSLPTDFPTSLPSDFPTAFPSGFPTGLLPSGFPTAFPTP